MSFFWIAWIFENFVHSISPFPPFSHDLLMTDSKTRFKFFWTAFKNKVQFLRCDWGKVLIHFVNFLIFFLSEQLPAKPSPQVLRERSAAFCNTTHFAEHRRVRGGQRSVHKWPDHLTCTGIKHQWSLIRMPCWTKVFEKRCPKWSKNGFFKGVDFDLENFGWKFPTGTSWVQPAAPGRTQPPAVGPNPLNPPPPNGGVQATPFFRHFFLPAAPPQVVFKNSLVMLGWNTTRCSDCNIQ